MIKNFPTVYRRIKREVIISFSIHKYCSSDYFLPVSDSMAGDREAVEAVLQEHVAFRRRKSSFIGTPSRGTGL